MVTGVTDPLTYSDRYALASHSIPLPPPPTPLHKYLFPFVTSSLLSNLHGPFFHPCLFCPFLLVTFHSCHPFFLSFTLYALHYSSYLFITFHTIRLGLISPFPFTFLSVLPLFRFLSIAPSHPLSRSFTVHVIVTPCTLSFDILLPVFFYPCLLFLFLSVFSFFVID